jgi:predicted nuclease of restriction endonuclease-like (RecB) superfamily
MGKVRAGASFPVASPLAELPGDYAGLLAGLKQRISTERLRAALAANAAMVLLYWDIGRAILQRQAQGGWGARVIDRLSADLRQAFPDMHGLSPRNLKYMRAFADAWPDPAIVQESLAQITWYQNLTLLEKLDNREDRLWYAAKAAEHGWSWNILSAMTRKMTKELIDRIFKEPGIKYELSEFETLGKLDEFPKG